MGFLYLAKLKLKSLYLVSWAPSSCPGTTTWRNTQRCLIPSIQGWWVNSTYNNKRWIIIFHTTQREAMWAEPLPPFDKFMVSRYFRGHNGCWAPPPHGQKKTCCKDIELRNVGTQFLYRKFSCSLHEPKKPRL